MTRLNGLKISRPGNRRNGAKVCAKLACHLKVHAKVPPRCRSPSPEWHGPLQRGVRVAHVRGSRFFVRFVEQLLRFPTQKTGGPWDVWLAREMGVSKPEMAASAADCSRSRASTRDFPMRFGSLVLWEALLKVWRDSDERLTS